MNLDDLKKQLNKIIIDDNNLDLNDLQNHLDKIVNQENHRPLIEFEGYSPDQMHNILHFAFSDYSPIKLQRLDDEDYEKIPILNQIRYLVKLIEKEGELALTKTGSLPVKVVAELYKQGFIKDEFIETGSHKLYKETDAISINLTRILLEITSIVKKRKGKLSLTKSSKKILADNDLFLRILLIAFGNRFNWSYFDGFGDNNIGNLGYGFSLILLSKYGKEKRLDHFYSEKYFNAFPNLLNNIPSHEYTSVTEKAYRCYSIRTFDRFLDYFGLIKIEEEALL